LKAEAKKCPHHKSNHDYKYMAVIVLTPTPAKLLQSVKDGIEKGTVETWTVDKDGDFTHSATQWLNQAWLRPSIENDRLKFFIIGRKNQKMGRAVYGVYHGRFIEMLVTHFDLEFSEASASALPVKGDHLGGSAAPGA
jgi:hypothetical protein